MLKSRIIRILFIILLLLLLASVIFVNYDNYRFRESERIPATETVGELYKGETLTQSICCELDGLKSIKILFATYNRINHGYVTVKLYSEEKEYNTWVIPCNKIIDNNYYCLTLDQRIRDSKGKKIFVDISSDGTAGDAVTIYKNSSGEYSGFSVNDKSVEGESLCVDLQYEIIPSGKEVFYIIRFMTIVGIILFLWLVVSKISHLSIHNAFLLFWLFFSSLYICSSTLFNVPDEYDHFYRSLEISEGHFFSEYDEEKNVGGRELPLDVELKLMRQSWITYNENKEMSLSANRVPIAFSNTAVYSPFTYFPQAIGIFIARRFSNNIPLILYAGRLINWIYITVLLYFAIKYLPYGKEFLALIALMPMNISEAVSLAPDGAVFAITAFFISYIMYLRTHMDKVLKPWELFFIGAVAFLISMNKIVYLPFCIFILLIPKERFRFRKMEKVFYIIILAVITCSINFIWLLYCRKFLTYPGTNSTVQLQYILHNPITYYVTFARTYIVDGLRLMMEMVGSNLGWLDVKVVELFIFSYVIFMIYKAHPNVKITGKKDHLLMIVSVVVVIVVFLLTSTSLYLQWTYVYNRGISGLQGRYFIPLLLPIYLLITKDGLIERDNIRTHYIEHLGFAFQWMVLLVNISACSSLLFKCLAV